MIVHWSLFIVKSFSLFLSLCIMCSKAGVLLNCSRCIRVQSPAFMFIWIMLQLTTEIMLSFFSSKDCGSSRLSNVEFGLLKLRSQTLYNGPDGQTCCWTCFLNNCSGLICLSRGVCLSLCSEWTFSEDHGFQRLRSNQCISLTKMGSVLFYICNSNVIC